ncbi:MAG: penicillin acylase family protein [Promethearchaeota archaeon]
MSTERKSACSCKSFAVLLIGFFLLSMMMPVVPWVQPNGGLWMDIHWANYPPYATEQLPGLDGDIRIIRDTWGVPHIFATTEHDMYLACGYVHAQDRLFQIDTYRRLAQGRLSEVYGQNYFDDDLFYRTLRLNETAEASYSLLSSGVQALIQSYADGFNLYLERIGSRVPMEFRVLGYMPEPWTAVDVLTIERLFSWMVSGAHNFQDLYMAILVDTFGNDTVWNELFPVLRYNDVPTVPPTAEKTQEPDISSSSILKAAKSLAARYRSITDESPLPSAPLSGSNSWVLNGSHTQSGAPLLCGDPHQNLLIPTFWYEVHLVGAGYNVRGVTFPGFPFILQGYNSHLAWSFTAMSSDDADFYYYRWDPANPDNYWWEGSWQGITQVPGTIYVKTGGVLTPYTYNFNTTVHGPLFDETDDRFAVKWNGNNGSRAAEGYLGITKASTYSAFETALTFLDSPSLNYLYADTSDNIAYHATGLHPIRPTGGGPTPMNGSTGTHEWLGFIPFAELPQSFNPSTGYLVSANNRPVNASYPYYLGYTFAPAHRARRITQLVNETTGQTVADMKSIQLDTYSLQAAALKDLVATVVLSGVTTTSHPLVYDAATELQSWDCQMVTTSIGATIWANFFPIFRKATFGDEYNQAGLPDGPFPDSAVLENLTLTNDPTWFNNVSLSSTQTRDDIILESFIASINELESLLGANMAAWQYGNVHLLVIEHTLSTTFPYLNAPIVPINGDEYTVSYSPGFYVNTGATWRQIIDLGNPAQSLGVIPGGQSSNPYSLHYLDQLWLWIAGDYHALEIPATPQAVTNPESELLLTPS